MAYTDIDKPSDYFNTKLYTGNNADGHAITGVGFQPDFLWIKCRNVAYSHRLYDSIRGVNSALISDQTAAENQYVDYGQLESFDSDGFTLGIGNTGGAGTNDGNNYVAWNWLASNTTASNTDGSITSTVSANTTSGFSIVSYTGNGTAGATIGHGLGTTPSMMIVKNRSSSWSWGVYHASLGATQTIFLDTTDATSTRVFEWNNTAPTSSVFTIGSGGSVNTSGNNYIAYCFAKKSGYSSMGKYTGNGSSDGTFVYTGFKPAFFITKASAGDTTNWNIYDNKRSTYNAVTKILETNTSNAEQTYSTIDFLSNGVKFRGSQYNNSGVTYITMAFAENPFVTSTGIPTTAR